MIAIAGGIAFAWLIASLASMKKGIIAIATKEKNDHYRPEIESIP